MNDNDSFCWGEILNPIHPGLFPSWRWFADTCTAFPFPGSGKRERRIRFGCLCLRPFQIVVFINTARVSCGHFFPNDEVILFFSKRNSDLFPFSIKNYQISVKKSKIAQPDKKKDPLFRGSFSISSIFRSKTGYSATDNRYKSQAGEIAGLARKIAKMRYQFFL